MHHVLMATVGTEARPDSAGFSDGARPLKIIRGATDNILVILINWRVNSPPPN